MRFSVRYSGKEAQRHQVAYTSADGDQPAVLARLVDELRFYGLRFVMAGNIKGFLDRYTDPIKIQPEAAKRYLDPQMCASYTDGTKLAVEMSYRREWLGLRSAAKRHDRPASRSDRFTRVF